jgi:hypothetical protein
VFESFYISPKAADNPWMRDLLQNHPVRTPDAFVEYVTKELIPSAAKPEKFKEYDLEWDAMCRSVYLPMEKMDAAARDAFKLPTFRRGVQVRIRRMRSNHPAFLHWTQ